MMPIDIEDDCFVVYDGEIYGLEYPIFILRGNAVSLAYYTGASSTPWFYDELNDAIDKKHVDATGFAGEFMTLTDLLNHTGGTLSEQEVTKEMVIYKAVPAS